MNLSEYLDAQFPYTPQQTAQFLTYYEITEKYSQWICELYEREWYLPLRLRLIEQDINKLINQIFQERPSLP